MRYFFEDYALDTNRRELRRGDGLVPVEPKVFDLLVHLVGNCARVVSKDDLIDAVWNGRIVSDSALTSCINAARNAIGDSGEAQRLIKTLPRKGFRFVGAVRHEQEQTEVALAGPWDLPRPTLVLPDKPSVAVVPFTITNLSGDHSQDYFSDGITEDIITALSRFSELFVIASNSSFTYKGKAVDVRQVGRELGVRYVLEGSIRRAGDRVRITAQLIDATTGAHRWGEHYDQEVKDIFAVQDEVARTIVSILVAHVHKAEVERTLLKQPSAWQAHDFYMKAAANFTSFMSSLKSEELYATRGLLEHSLAIDPNYARALATLSSTYVLTWTQPLDGDYLKPTALERAYELARKAVQVDANLPQAHAQLGWVLSRRGEQDQAIAEFERAVALNPNSTDHRFGGALVYAGEAGRAVQVLKAHMRLDPFYTPLAPGFLGLAHYMLKQYAEALAPLRECISRAPNFLHTHVWLAANYAQLGQMAEARAEVTEVLRIGPKYTIDGTSGRIATFKNPKDAAHFFGGLRKAGLPEH